ncbi:sucrase ferredoxin, partial [filamentous cyanobacterium CCT1]
QPQALARFEAYRQPTQPSREILVCTHGNVDVACSKFGFPIYQQLRQGRPDTPSPPPRIWRCSHFGGHNFAPTLVDLPTGQMWGHLEPEVLATLIQRQGNVADLRQFYRGWCGLDRFEQMVEREIWTQHGWDWLSYKKWGETVAIAPAEDPYYADWAEVRLHYAASDGSEAGTYAARVEVCGEVITQWNSGPDEPLEAQKQYRVLNLRPIDSGAYRSEVHQ